LLHIPDNLSRNAFEAMLKEDEIKNVFNLIEHSYILIHGIGEAGTMSKKRNLPKEIIDEIQLCGGVGEAFGHYFNNNGEVVYSMPIIGITKENISQVENMIAVAAGSEKAKAIIAVEKNKKNSILVTDEATAKEILSLLK
jgi:central glycolytic genes regulator